MLWPRGRERKAGWHPIIGQLTVSQAVAPTGAKRGGLEGGADPALLASIVEISEAEAKNVAKGRGLPTQGW